MRKLSKYPVGNVDLYDSPEYKYELNSGGADSHCVQVKAVTLLSATEREGIGRSALTTVGRTLPYHRKHHHSTSIQQFVTSKLPLDIIKAVHVVPVVLEGCQWLFSHKI